jgi:hypothetical protein
MPAPTDPEEDLSLRPGTGDAVDRHQPDPALRPGAAVPERDPGDMDPSLLARQAGSGVERSLSDAGIGHMAPTPSGDVPGAGHVDAAGATFGAEPDRASSAASGGPVTSVGGTQNAADPSVVADREVDSTGGPGDPPTGRAPGGAEPR